MPDTVLTRQAVTLIAQLWQRESHVVGDPNIAALCVSHEALRGELLLLAMAIKHAHAFTQVIAVQTMADDVLAHLHDGKGGLPMT